MTDEKHSALYAELAPEWTGPTEISPDLDRLLTALSNRLPVPWAPISAEAARRRTVDSPAFQSTVRAILVSFLKIMIADESERDDPPKDDPWAEGHKFWAHCSEETKMDLEMLICQSMKIALDYVALGGQLKPSDGPSDFSS